MAHKDEFEQTMKSDIEARVREGVKAVLEEVLQEEMTEHLKAGYRELTPTRKGQRNGHYQRKPAKINRKTSKTLFGAKTDARCGVKVYNAL